MENHLISNDMLVDKNRVEENLGIDHLKCPKKKHNLRKHFSKVPAEVYR